LDTSTWPSTGFRFCIFDWEIEEQEAFLSRSRRFALRYVDGQNIVIEWRFAKGKVDRLPELAAEVKSEQGFHKH
jgi:hypothetical protein